MERDGDGRDVHRVDCGRQVLDGGGARVRRRVDAGRDPAATLRKYELKAAAHEEKRRERAAAQPGSRRT